MKPWYIYKYVIFLTPSQTICYVLMHISTCKIHSQKKNCGLVSIKEWQNPRLIEPQKRTADHFKWQISASSLYYLRKSWCVWQGKQWAWDKMLSKMYPHRKLLSSSMDHICSSLGQPQSHLDMHSPVSEHHRCCSSLPLWLRKGCSRDSSPLGLTPAWH